VKRSRNARRWRRKGYTHEIAYWSAQGKPWNFVLVTRSETAAYFRKNGTEDDWVRPIGAYFIHNGRKPR
jgi:ribosomal protein L25 (general stress protein Ctc)